MQMEALYNFIASPLCSNPWGRTLVNMGALWLLAACLSHPHGHGNVP